MLQQSAPQLDHHHYHYHLINSSTSSLPSSRAPSSLSTHQIPPSSSTPVLSFNRLLHLKLQSRRRRRRLWCSSPLSLFIPCTRSSWRKRKLNFSTCCFSLSGNNTTDEEAAAREAVLQLLVENGASQQDSSDIVSNSPKYIRMLLDNVRELDDHSLWTSWNPDMIQHKNEGEVENDDDIAGFSLKKKKLYFMAKSKRDGGILPFLESIGLKYASALFIARYIVTRSERLPDLITKVNFLKNVLFSSNMHKELIGRNARRMMMNLSISTDEDIHKTLSFFQKLEAKPQGLDMLGCGGSFSVLIESFPDLLLLSVDNHLMPLLDYLQQIGVSKESIRAVLLLFPPIFFLNINRDIKPRLYALEKAGVGNNNVGRMLLKYPWILSARIQENCEKIHKFFHDKKVLKLSVDVAINSWPHLLGCATEKMEPIMDQFGKLGVERRMLGPVITSSPQILMKKPDEFLQVVSFMEEIGFDHRTIGKILCRCPEIFAVSVDNTLRRKVKFLTDFGILKGHLHRVIRKYPELLLLDTHHTLLPRMKYLMRAGLTKREVCFMVCKFSPLLGYSVEVVLKPKLEFLLREMGKPLEEVVEYPRYFSYSLEKKIMRRFLVIRSRNIQCSLKDMLAKNDEDFAKHYMDIDRFLLLLPPSSTSTSISSSKPNNDDL